MEAEFWHNKWEKRQLGFHRADENPLLVAHLHALGLDAGARLFLPLCGKTLDIAWLLSQGFEIAGVELSEVAVKELFEELNVTPTISVKGDLRLYEADGLKIYAGDFFQLSAEELGTVDGVYDRAALVALPPKMRVDYAAHLRTITNSARQLLITFHYDQDLMSGPPFAVPDDEVAQHYQDHYAIKPLATEDATGSLKGDHATIEQVWLLKPL